MGDCDFLEFVSANILSDREIVVECVKRDPQRVELVSPALKRCCEFVLRYMQDRCLTVQGTVLRDAWERLREDRDFILQCVQSQAEVIMFASNALYADADLVFDAIQLNWKVFEFVAVEFRGDYAFVLEAVKRCWLSIRFAVPGFVPDFQLVLEAVKQDWRAIQEVLMSRDFSHEELAKLVDANPRIRQSSIFQGTLSKG